ncbi:purine nucleoside phosphorylase [Monocercomonoides exilis]|uniref:purine nucleoside phosphorylase n=1 Tax=Monocercomonoides exilis TaxID=2049356 RepID=UPI00355A6730|nr:purine nucleoside phosphorylase [Monocercomonoides exilis]|eukprot:MONOS_1782.1-p1 / transcript=MONOS_1782.1 / gene=MONOS_1782 / organism=Monocercomonoides_exilis_PA203 / gene_product=purine nucleoside phosphorylase [EC:2.4.2.1] / transcript_product=purine nucleoside phosphorylase [EC:2.4.2.1] / location=Mono_scaffold00033:104101-105149(+) / protein_length=285 / sequence_SO=supercontig / SO=protein_coding / is_pseudo=false
MSEFPTIADLEETVAAIRAKAPGFQPKIGIILGTGLSGMGEQLDESPAKIVMPYAEVPHFAKSTVIGHAGNLLLGYINGVPVMCMQGRFHYYEGYSLNQVTYPVRVMAKMGVKGLVVSNAAGCLNADWQVGDIALITDHINFQGTNPLIGPNKDFFPPYSTRFPDMSDCYDKKMREAVKEVAAKKDLKLREGVYFAMSGPSYETSAEHKFIKIVGGDFVGMSTAPEVIVARHSGLRCVGFSVMTNMCVPGVVADHAVIGDVGRSAGDRLVPLLRDSLPGIAAQL